jgi:hypothetical protein
MADALDALRCQRPVWRARATLAAAGLSLAVIVSGCGSPQVNYAVPKDLCGLPVKSDLVRPFFPPGDRVQFDGDVFVGGGDATSACQYYVDGNTALVMDGKRSAEQEEATELARRIAMRSHLKSWTQSGGRIAGYAGTVYGTTDCSENPSASYGRPTRSFTLEISATDHSGEKAERPELAKLMGALLPKAAHARGCA